MGFNSGFKGLKCFEIKIILVINSCKGIEYFSFYFNLKITRVFFLPDPVLATRYEAAAGKLRAALATVRYHEQRFPSVRTTLEANYWQAICRTDV